MRKIIHTFITTVIALQIGIFMPTTAHASLFTEVLDAAASAAARAAGWPSDLPSPEALIALITIAQDCKDSNIMSCVIEAENNPTIRNLLGDSVDKIDQGLQIYQDINNGDYLNLIEKLGKTAGCAAAAILTGVPICDLAEAIAAFVGGLADSIGAAVAAAEEFYSDVFGDGAPDANFYKNYWAPQVLIGAKVLAFSDPGDTRWGDYLVPLYNACFANYRSGSIGNRNSEDHSRDICDGQRQQFTDDANIARATLESNARLAISNSYDVKSSKWKKEWPATVCNVADTKIKSDCQAKVQAAFDSGRLYAVSKWKDCRWFDKLIFDVDQCAEMGYQHILNSKTSGGSELAMAVKAAQTSGGGIPLTSAGDQLKTMADGYAIVWLPQCETKDCVDEIKNIAMSCAIGVSNLPPLQDGASDIASVSLKRKSEYIAANCSPKYQASVTKSKTDKATADKISADYYASQWKDKCADGLCQSNIFAMMLERVLAEDELKDPATGIRVKRGGEMPMDQYNALKAKYEEKARQEITASGPRAANVRKDAIQQMAASYLGKCSTLLCKANVMTKAAEWYDAIFTLDTKTPVQLAQKNQLDASYRKQLAALVGDAPASGSSTFGSPAPSAAIAAGAAGAGTVTGATAPTKSSITTPTKTSATAPTTAPNNLPSPAVAAPPTTPPPTQPSNSPAGRPAPIQSLTTTTALDAANEKLLKEKSCVNVAGGKAGNYQCKTSDGIKVCEALKRDQKVTDCKRIN